MVNSPKRKARLGRALDKAVADWERSENRRRLTKATAEYYGSLSSDELREENSLGECMSKAAARVIRRSPGL
jgi:hypothetical protein